MPTSGSPGSRPDRKSTRLNSSHDQISYAVFCLKKKKKDIHCMLELRRELIRRKKLDGGPLVGMFYSRNDRAPRSVECARAMTGWLQFRSVIVTRRQSGLVRSKRSVTWVRGRRLLRRVCPVSLA